MNATDRPTRIYRAPRALRRFFVAYVVFLVLFATMAFTLQSSWPSQVNAMVLLVGMAPLAFLNLTYVEVRRDGIAVDRPVRRRVVGWPEIATIRLVWPPPRRRPKLPEVELRDGTVIRSAALARLGSPERRAEREAFVERLEDASGRHGFALEVQLPETGSTTS